MEFQAETQRILQIVANSLYQDKEVFVRELVSNAADALEKLRYVQQAETAESDATQDDEEHALAISISTDDEKGTFTISDNGVGMSREQLIENLGTIARSGSKAFMEEVKDKTKGDEESSHANNIIGQFGVGFYSIFMVGQHVEVYSRAHGSDVGHVWRSDGSGRYEIAEADNVDVGTTIVITLKEDEASFADKNNVCCVPPNMSICLACVGVTYYSCLYLIYSRCLL